MARHMTTPPDVGWVDKRRSAGGTSAADDSSRVQGSTIFTANAVGTTTTIVGADAVLGTGVNVVRIGEKAKVLTSAGAVRDEKVVTITGASSATGTTTVTFTPALASATASGDTLRLVGDKAFPFTDNDSMDDRLLDAGYTQTQLNDMTQNDKVYALRTVLDSSGI